MSYRVHLAADALWACEVRALGHFGRGGRRAVRKARFGFEPASIDAAGAAHRAAAFEALRAWMGSPPVRASQEWVLGLSEVRHLVLPWSPELADSALRAAFAAARFEQQFRQAPSSHAMQFAKPAFGAPLLAAFVAQELLVQLQAHAAASRVRLASVTPSLSAVWRRFHSVLHGERGMLSLIDGPRQMAVHHDRGRIERITLRPFDAAHPAPLGAEAQAPAGIRRRVFAAAPPCQCPSEAVLTLADGDGFDAKHDSAYAYALCGVF